jgi:hypothetical protein
VIGDRQTTYHLPPITYLFKIGVVSPTSGVPRAPYALAPIAFPLPALATMAGRAPLGGPREISLACFLVARLVADMTATSDGLTQDQRKARALSAKHWLGSAAIPSQVKSALLRLAELTGEGDRGVIKAGLDSVMTVTANQLDSAARLELGRLAQVIAE